MKILTISNLYPPDGFGGYERQSAELVEALSARGHELSVLTSPISTRMVRDDSVNEMVHRVFHLANEYAPLTNDPAYLAAQSLQSRLVNAHNISILVAHLRQFRPDVVLLCNLLGLGGLQILATLDSLGIPWVWSLADPLPQKLCDVGKLSDLAELFSIKKMGDSHHFKGAFVSDSRRLFQFIADDRCSLDGALHVVPYWVHGEPGETSGRDYFVKGKPLRMCFVGYVGANKGMDIVLQATKLLQQDEKVSVTLDVYGAGEIEQFEKLSIDLGLQSVKFHGFKNSEEVPQCYAAHDVLLFPSMVREPFGNVTLEAAMRGCVPIINSMCGAAEFLEDGVTCLQSERDATAFADTVKRVLAGEVDLREMAESLPAKVHERFKISDAVEEYEKIFANCAKTFAASGEQLDEALLASMKNEQVVFARLERDLATERVSTEWLKNEVQDLSAALAEAKNGITAYDLALTGEKHKLAACENRLSIVENSRIWKLHRFLQPILKDKLTDV